MTREDTIEDTFAAPKPSACEIASYTDHELRRYLVDNGRVVSVQDPENISPEFIERLKTIDQCPVQSHQIDLDLVTARLQAAPDEIERLRRSPSIATTEPLPSQEVQDLRHLREETQAFTALVAAGGRPPYPHHLLEDFFWHPEHYVEHDEYRDIILFWQQGELRRAQRTLFSSCQLLRWVRFRRLQHIIRERSFVSPCALFSAAYCDSWEQFVDRYGSCEGLWGFQQYADNLKSRLSQYGFTRPFQLIQDLDGQDKLATWIEYLGYEHSFYDQADSNVKGLQRRHDDAWRALVESGLLRADETYAVVCNSDTPFQDEREKAQAEKAFSSAIAAVSSTERAIITSKSSGEILRKRLFSEQATLEAAKERYDLIKARDDAFSQFFGAIKTYRCEKHEVDRYSLLLRWIVRQVPSIELELSSLNSTEDRPKQSRKLKRTRDDTIDDGRRSKRLKSGGSDGRSTALESSVLAILTSPPDMRSRSTETPEVGKDLDEPIRVIKPLRCSARIAERAEETAENVVQTRAPRPTIRQRRAAISQRGNPPKKRRRRR